MRDREFADSLLEGDGFEPSVPLAKESVSRKGKCDKGGGLEKRCPSYGDRRFESRFLHRRVLCEPDFLDRGWHRVTPVGRLRTSDRLLYGKK